MWFVSLIYENKIYRIIKRNSQIHLILGAIQMVLSAFTDETEKITFKEKRSFKCIK